MLEIRSEGDVEDDMRNEEMIRFAHNLVFQSVIAAIKSTSFCFSLVTSCKRQSPRKKGIESPYSPLALSAYCTLL